MRATALIFALSLAVPVTASAVTANLCLRNDGVGTFSSSDLYVFSNSDWNAGDRTDFLPGFGYSLSPGQGSCYAISGLNAWNGYQYQYIFEIQFMDTTGNVTFFSPANLQFTSSSGSYYVSTLGVTTYNPGQSNYISVVNQAPPAWPNLSAYPNPPNTDTTCYVYWSGLTLSSFSDWDHNRLERATSASGPWTTVYSQYAWGSQYRSDTGLTPGQDYSYRVVSVDEYGAETVGPTASCTTTGGVVDADGDGATSDVDCDDGDPLVYPGATETCDGQDNDCDGLTDDADPGVVGQGTWYEDGDNDGWGGLAVVECVQPTGTLTTGGDCDDTNGAVNPAASEVCDGLDNDCDGSVDEGSSDVDGDGEADCVDEDDDDDGLTDDEEAALGTNPLNGDTDGDGVGDAEEVGDPNNPWDTDGDGWIDADDPDDDGDGIDTAIENGTDVDGDGVADTDVDGDGVDNYLDDDSDEDGVPDDAEGTGDADGDGVPAYLDPDEDGSATGDDDDSVGDDDDSVGDDDDSVGDDDDSVGDDDDSVGDDDDSVGDDDDATEPGREGGGCSGNSLAASGGGAAGWLMLAGVVGVRRRRR